MDHALIAHVTWDRYEEVRTATRALCTSLEVEDCAIQSMPDVSPTKWHLAHTSWFFERFVLMRHAEGYREYDPRFHFLFNSYYQTVGPMHARPQRGLLSRPSLAEVWRYRGHVDEAMADLLSTGVCAPEVHALVELGMHHEQQHQELMLTDIKHVFWCNPMRPTYRAAAVRAGSQRSAPPVRWLHQEGGICWVGAPVEGFAFDNERPRHRQFLEPFQLASRLVNAGEYAAFIEDGGYQRPELWLSEGWARVCDDGWDAPLYWEQGDRGWQIFTLAGTVALDPSAPVAHVSYFEADAYARWKGARLPTEAEWEVLAGTLLAPDGRTGNFVESGALTPLPVQSEPVQRELGQSELRPSAAARPTQLFGDAWEWTRSAYAPFPGFLPFDGSLAEYNGKFMCGQQVLKGGSCVTPASHIRTSYRNFFPPATRWQFSGIRLAKDA